MKKVLSIVIILVSLLLASCSLADKIEGSWSDEQGSVFTFYKDGTMTIKTDLLTASGTYEFIEKDKMKLEMDGLFALAGSMVYDVDISGKHMELGMDGDSMILTKE